MEKQKADYKLQLLVLDDDEIIHNSIDVSLPDHWQMTAIKSIKNLPERAFHAAFIDMHLSKNESSPEGLEAIRILAKKDSHLEIVAISGDLDRALMENCLKAGASRFLAKPLSTEEIILVLSKIEALYLMQNARQRKSGSLQWTGESEESKSIRKQIASFRGEPGPVLIEGESGTGKEITARLINEQEDQPFVTVNISAIPETLFESELFGHVKGAFTGADQNKMGLTEAAHGGDLFLDEIEALPMPVQAKLLRFLENGEIKRVGSKETIKVNVRVIAATNQNLEGLVKEGKFREDLMWRLNGKKIVLPPLRKRPSDIEILAKYFLEQERPRRNKTLSKDAIEFLKKYSWPGNVRELKRVLEQLCLTSPLPIIRTEDVSSVIKPATTVQVTDASTIELSLGLDQLVEGFEKLVIAQALQKDTDVDRVAQLLKISRSSLYKKIKDYGLEI